MPQRSLPTVFLWTLPLTLALGFSSKVAADPNPEPAKKESPADKKPEARPSPMLLLASYMSDTHDRIQKAWDVSKIPWVDLNKLHAILSLTFDSQGKLSKVILSRPSGSPAFDASLLAAAQKITLAKPDPSIVDTLKETGLEIMIRRAAFKRQRLPLKTHYSGDAVVPLWEPRQPPPRRR